MLTWLNDTLNSNPNKKFMTQAHVYYGNNYYEGLENMWYLNYTT
jgi:hypothetical protein